MITLEYLVKGLVSSVFILAAILTFCGIIIDNIIESVLAMRRYVKHFGLGQTGRGIGIAAIAIAMSGCATTTWPTSITNRTVAPVATPGNTIEESSALTIGGIDTIGVSRKCTGPGCYARRHGYGYGYGQNGYGYGSGDPGGRATLPYWQPYNPPRLPEEMTGTGCWNEKRKAVPCH